MLPVLSRRSFGQHPSSVPSVFLEEPTRRLSNGRSALAVALRLVGLGDSHRVLVPAYHCGSLVEPAAWTGASIEFYRVRSDLTVDVDDVERRIDDRTRCLVLVHYFGFPQPVRDLVALCRARGVAIVEDCAHAFFGSVAGSTVGAAGAVAIASTKKFFPVDAGGLLVGRGVYDELAMRSAPLAWEAKGVARAALAAAEYGRLGVLGSLLRGASQIRSSCPRPRTADVAEGRERWHWLSPKDLDRAPPRSLTWLLARLDFRRVVEKRRTHYRALHEGLTGLRGGSPLHETLPEGVVPYTFPFVLREPDENFRRLKEVAVPMWRWEEVARSDCAVSDGYVSSLVQIPCHQELRESEVLWLVETIRKVLA